MKPIGVGLHTIFLLCMIIVAVSGFNLDLTSETAKYMTSPVLKALGSNNTGSAIPMLAPGVPPSFYGYQMDLRGPSGDATQPRLVIGAPKMTDPSNPGNQKKPTKPEKGKEAKFKPRGSVKACPVQETFFNSGGGAPPTCTPANPTPTAPGDAFGTSIAASPDGKMSACSTIRPQDCSVDKYNPGFCFKSKNSGGKWVMDEASKAATCPSETVDVVFVLDGSGSVEGNFKIVKKWVRNIVEQLRIQMETGYVQIGVVQYSHYYKDRSWSTQRYMTTEIQLGKYAKFEEFRVALNKIKHHDFTTHTGRVLEKVVSDFNDSSRFQKKNNNQMMLLMTDGQSNDPDLVAPNAAKLRAMGVTTFAVGVGNAVKEELRKIATGTNTDERVYSVDNFNELDGLVEQLKTKILAFVLEGGNSQAEATYNTEFAQTGFSSAFEDKRVRL